MYGWRLRVGYVGPRPLDVPPHEFWSHAPPGVVMIAAGAGQARSDGSGWTFDEASLVRCVRELQKFEPEALVLNWADAGVPTDYLACAVASAAAGPVVSDVDVLVDVLQRRDVETLSLATPWDEAHARTVAGLLRGAGHTVVGTAASGCAHLCDVGDLSVAEVIEVGRRAVGTSRPDALVLASAHWRTMAAQDEIARALDVPVISLNGALLWNVQDILRLRLQDQGVQPDAVSLGSGPR